MACLTGLEPSYMTAAVAALWAAAVLVLGWVVLNHRFAGKPAFALTCMAMLWWLLTVGFELSSQGLYCKEVWALAAWPAITLLPIAWAFFVFDYTMNIEKGRKPVRLFCYLGLPALVGGIALTNDWHHLLYGEGTHIVGQGARAAVVYDQGPVFLAIVAGLYAFTMSALSVLAYAFLKAERNIRPFLFVLIVITIAPLAANVAYVVWDFTIFGYDPTSFMFSGALMAFSWLLVNHRMMDTEAQGQDLLFYATHDPVIIMDAAGRFAGANAAAEALLGEQLPAYGEKLDHLEKIGPVLGFLAETGELTCAEPITFGERIYDPRALPIASPIQTKNNLLGWTVALVDITERERTAVALRKALVRAEAANHAKTEFLAVISHELRTPMTSLKGGLDLVLGGVVGEISDPVRDMLGIARKNCARLQKLIDDILDLQKLDLNGLTLAFQDVDPNEFLRETVREHEAQAAAAKVRFNLALDDTHRRLRTDPHRLKQVLGNVLSNAVKFSPEGGRVDCCVAIAGDKLRMSVRDRGIGIPENSEERVFGRFIQIDSSSTRASEGSGLGMHIAKRLIERLGGTISYESRLGAGTTFHIEMPLEPRDEASRATGMTVSG